MVSRNHATEATSSDPLVEALQKWFGAHPVAQLDDLRGLLGASTRTVFRALSRAGYCSSFSHAGRYYTLADVPRFDEQGLWFNEHVGFSLHGTLRSTLVHLVEQAPAGSTHEELQATVRLRAHDTLRSLVEARLIGRELVEALFVYLSASPARAGLQLAKRKELLASPLGTSSAPLDVGRLIDVLLAVIHQPAASAAQIALGLRLRGLAVSDEQVETTFGIYALGKKTAPSPSRRSRR
jgi:hypothetical protein